LGNKKFAIIGFSKCGTMSLAEYLKAKNPKCEVSRPENIYEEDKKPHLVQKWREWVCCTITRTPLDRIHSCHQYFTILRQNSIQDILKGRFHNSKNYYNVGAANLIQQSNYEYFIQKFERHHGVSVQRYRFEDLKDDPDFPHINESEIKMPWTEAETKYVQDALDKAGITY
jgi:hypothetical protein